MKVCCWYLVYVLDCMLFLIIGTLKLCIRLLIIQYILIEIQFTLQKLKTRIDSFFYGPDIANKPSPINAMHLTNGHLKQFGMFVNCSKFNNINLHFKLQLPSQMWCLGKYLPLLIGDLVKEENHYWENYLAHADIVDEVFVPVTSVDRTEYTAMNIEDFFHNFKELYPNNHSHQKCALLLHLPVWMRWSDRIIIISMILVYQQHSVILYFTFE